MVLQRVILLVTDICLHMARWRKLERLGLKHPRSSRVLKRVVHPGYGLDETTKKG